MKFKKHLYVEIVIFGVLSFLINVSSAFVVTLFHFIPTPDYIMKKVGFRPKLHRHLFHNVFILIVALIIAGYYVDRLIIILAASNFILHILMDMVGKNGVAFFYPLSSYRIKFNK